MAEQAVPTNNQHMRLTEMKIAVPYDIWTSKEVAAYWKIPSRMVTDMAVRGEIPGAFKLQTYWRFRSEQIRAVGKTDVAK